MATSGAGGVGNWSTVGQKYICWKLELFKSLSFSSAVAIVCGCQELEEATRISSRDSAIFYHISVRVLPANKALQDWVEKAKRREAIVEGVVRFLDH